MILSPAPLFRFSCTGLLALLSFLLAVAGNAAGQQPQPAPNAPILTLEHAINLALENNRSLQNAALDAEKAGDSLSALRTRRLPSFKFYSLTGQPLTTFDFTFEKGLFGTFPGIGPVPAEQTTITSSGKPSMLLIGSATQPLTQLFRTNLNLKQKEMEREISRAQLQLKQQALVRDVKQAYYGILQTSSEFANAQEAIKLYRELDRVTANYVTLQVALKPDLLDVQTRLANAEYELLTIDNQIATRKEQFNNLLGRPIQTEFALSPVVDVVQFMMSEADLESAQKKALTQRPELVQARLKIKQAEYDRRAKKTEYLPDVSLSLNYLSPLGFSDFLPTNIAQVGVLVEWDVFDWGRKKRELAEKTKTVKQAGNSLLDTENQVLMEVNQSYRRLHESTQAMRVARLSQETARSNVEVALNRYQVQASLLKDVLQAQTSLADANYQYQKAMLGFWIAKAEFEKAIGDVK